MHGPDGNLKPFCKAEMFERLVTEGLTDPWRNRNREKEEFSFYSNAGNGFRIDHVLTSPAAGDSVRSIGYDHSPRTRGLTDHSALVVELG